MFLMLASPVVCGTGRPTCNYRPGEADHLRQVWGGGGRQVSGTGQGGGGTQSRKGYRGAVAVACKHL